MSLLLIDDGEIFFDGKNLKKYKEKDYYPKVSAVLEGNRNIYWYQSALENIYFFGYLKGLKKDDIKNKADRLLKIFDLYEQRNQKVSQYSRGMQQKLAIIISLLNDPLVLFLDEPTLGLDVVSKHNMIKILKEISKSTTIVLTTHQMDVVEKLAQNIILLDHGNILFDGDIKKLKDKEKKDKLRMEVYDPKRITAEIFKQNFIKQEGSISLIDFKRDNFDFNKVDNVLRENGLELINLKLKDNNIEDIFLKQGENNDF